MIDRIITMCATLTNLSNRIVPLDLSISVFRDLSCYVLSLLLLSAVR